jgi:hypothetical protein
LATPDGVQLAAELGREGTVLMARWLLVDPRRPLNCPRAVAGPRRRFALWEETCFELFLAADGVPGYWELHLTPAGDWNVFRLEGYREGLREEPTVVRSPAVGEGAIALDTAVLGLGDLPWRIGVAAVMAEPGGSLTYWAAAHPGAEADFHHPEAFVVAL